MSSLYYSNTYFSSSLICRVQYHSTSDAPSTLKIASWDAKLPQKTHLLRLSFCRTIFSSRIWNSLSDIRVFSIHDIYLWLLGSFILAICAWTGQRPCINCILRDFRRYLIEKKIKPEKKRAAVVYSTNWDKRMSTVVTVYW
jgi:hypothetical protein